MTVDSTRISTIARSEALTPTILCVDDEPDVCSATRRFLGARNYRVLTATSALEALQLLETQTPDLVLMDARMPGMDGYQLCEKLSRLPGLACTPVVFRTGAGEETSKARAFAVGAVDFLVKSEDGETLLAIIEKHLRTRHRWAETQRAIGRGQERGSAEGCSGEDGQQHLSFSKFRDGLLAGHALDETTRARCKKIGPSGVYDFADLLHITQAEISRSMADFLGHPYQEDIDPERVRLGVLPKSFCRSRSVLAFQGNDERECFLVSNPFDWETIDALRHYTGHGVDLHIRVVEPAAIQRLAGPVPTGRAPEQTIASLEQKIHRLLPDDQKRGLPVDDLDEESEPIILLVNRLFEEAFEMGASDVHVEPEEECVVIRNRIDGELRIMHRLRPASLIRTIVARIKIMSGLDIAERRLPQDGRITFDSFSDRKLNFDLRVSTAPIVHGEKVVLRILHRSAKLLSLNELGFSPDNLRRYSEAIRAPYGMILHVGPTGSGKSMSLYAALARVSDPRLNIQTVEDPVEYTLPSIRQMQVHREIGLTFAQALRCFLRQDPDVLMVGEIRDAETAQIAVEAALTGHLLFSTLHTCDAASTVPRFYELGVDPTTLSSALGLICAQRLVRRLCSECKVPYEPQGKERQALGSGIVYRAEGCEHCSFVGYRGRVGIHEILMPDEIMRVAISKGNLSADSLKELAIERCGMASLYQDALQKVRQGVCSYEEALAKVRPDKVDRGVAQHPAT